MTKVILEKYASKTDSYALVQEQNGTAYLYLYIRPKTQNEVIKAVWLRNYVEAQNGIDQKAEKSGEQPIMPFKATNHPKGKPLFCSQDLEIVFFDDFDGVALLEKGELIAAIPGWAGQNNFSGYAKDAIGSSIFATELGSPENNEIFKKVEQAKELWNDIENNNLWEKYQTERLSFIKENFGDNFEYFAIDNGVFPPKAIVKIEKDNAVYLITVGVGIISQPLVEQYTQTPENYRRLELAFAVEKNVFKKYEKELFAYLSGIADIPWNYTSFLAEGDTVLFDVKIDDKFTNSILVSESFFSNKEPQIFRGDVLNLLWIVPITKQEQELAEQLDLKSFIKNAKDENSLRIFDLQNKFNQKQ